MAYTLLSHACWSRESLPIQMLKGHMKFGAKSAHSSGLISSRSNIGRDSLEIPQPTQTAAFQIDLISVCRLGVYDFLDGYCQSVVSSGL